VLREQLLDGPLTRSQYRSVNRREWNESNESDRAGRAVLPGPVGRVPVGSGARGPDDVGGPRLACAHVVRSGGHAGVSVPCLVLYALHDALVKPMPGQPMAASLAESWTTSRDGLVYEFALRKSVTFYNGHPVTAEMERAVYFNADTEKAFKHIVRVGSAAAGNAATRIEAFVISGSSRSYGGYPDIDGLYREQAREMDAKKREAILHRIQQLVHEKVMFAPIVETAFLNGHGARVAEPGLGLIVGHLYSAPYEDLRLKE